MTPRSCDIVVVGAGVAGLAAAVHLARAGRDVQLVDGGAEARAETYRNECFFTVCNYEQAVKPFLETNKLSASERAVLMGESTAKAYRWKPSK